MLSLICVIRLYIQTVRHSYTSFQLFNTCRNFSLYITLSLIGSKWVGNFNDYQYSPEHLICMVPLLKSLFVNTCERISLFSMINMSEFFMPFPMFLSLLF